MTSSWRAFAALGVVAAGTIVALASSPAAADDVTAVPSDPTVCFDANLPRARTEIDADVAVQQFNPALGTLLEVTVTGPSLHLDTDAVFESIASSPVVFAEHMDYSVTATSPAGLPSPPPATGTIPRIPSVTLDAFDGTLDFLGSSAVTQPSITRDETGATVSSTDLSVLGALTGTGTVPFHLATAITETFTGDGGNVQFQVNTFAAVGVQVCYRYALPVALPVAPPVVTSPPPAAPPFLPPPPAAGEVAPKPSLPAPATVRALPATGRSTAPLTVAGLALLGLGAALAWRGRAPRPSLDA
jgi:LPXTG-motif cell wall-anchored protein